MRKRHTTRHILITSLLILLSSATLFVAIYMLWYFNRPLPDSITRQSLFDGVTYTRIVEPEKPLVYHVVHIDLNAAGIGFMVTPEDDINGFVYSARTTGQFLSEHNLQLAINGDFFDPWRDYGPLNYYPHVGDGVNVRGVTIAEGNTVTEGYAPQGSYATLYLTADNRAAFSPFPDDEIQTAISGNTMIVENGRYSLALEQSDYLKKRHPRTAIALDESGETLILFIVDGRQPSYSRGMSMEELAEIIIAQDGYTALNLDGGGSATLVIEGDNGVPQVLSAPIHTRIPYRQRPIANHFGVYANKR